MGDAGDSNKVPSDTEEIDVAFIANWINPPLAKHIIKMHWEMPSPNIAMQKWILK